MSKKDTHTMSRMLLLLSVNKQEGYTHTMSRMLLLLSANEQEVYIHNEQDASVVECK